MDSTSLNPAISVTAIEPVIKYPRYIQVSFTNRKERRKEAKLLRSKKR